MSNFDARDPYLGINEHIRNQSRSVIPTYYTIGKVTSIEPIVVRAAGIDLDKKDLLVAQHLLPGWLEERLDIKWPVQATLPQARFHGLCSCGYGAGTCYVDRPGEIVYGKTISPLTVGDSVMLIPSNDGQRYYLVDKLVEVDV